MKSFEEQLAEALYYHRISIKEAKFLYNRKSLLCIVNHEDDNKAIKLFKKAKIDCITIVTLEGEEPEVI